MKKHTLICLLLLCTGCKMGEDFIHPAGEQPPNWVAGPADPQAIVEQDWWKHFHDPLLDQLIATALKGSFDIQIAQARIHEARASKSSAANALIPTLNTVASGERQANRLAFGDGGGPIDLKKPFNVFQAGFDASWELDLFGVNRRRLEAADADLAAVTAAGDGARASLLAEVARTYVDIRESQVQLKLAHETIDAESKTASIARERFKVGETSEFDVSQADAQVTQARAQIPYYENRILQSQYSMDVLLGEKPGTSRQLTAVDAPIPLGDKAIVLAAPAKVIAERPDIRQAEAALASATAQRGAAVGQFFPDVSVSGFLGLLSPALEDLGQRDKKSWAIGGNVLWPILNYGKLSANLNAADARKQEALAQYRKTVLAALVDVERSVTAYTKEEAHLQALMEVVRYNHKTVGIARERYREGLSSFIDVLDAERSLYASQNQVAASWAATAQNLIATYKSLGGGWKDAAPAATGAVKP